MNRTPKPSRVTSNASPEAGGKPSRAHQRFIMAAYIATLFIVFIGAAGFAEIATPASLGGGFLGYGGSTLFRTEEPTVLYWWPKMVEGFGAALLAPLLVWHAVIHLPRVIALGPRAVPAAFGVMSAWTCTVGFVVGAVVPGVSIWETRLANGFTAQAIRAELRNGNPECEDIPKEFTGNFSRRSCLRGQGESRSLTFAIGEQSILFAMVGGILMYATLAYSMFATHRAKGAGPRKVAG